MSATAGPNGLSNRSDPTGRGAETRERPARLGNRHPVFVSWPGASRRSTPLAALRPAWRASEAMMCRKGAHRRQGADASPFPARRFARRLPRDRPPTVCLLGRLQASEMRLDQIVAEPGSRHRLRRWREVEWGHPVVAAFGINLHVRGLGKGCGDTTRRCLSTGPIRNDLDQLGHREQTVRLWSDASGFQFGEAVLGCSIEPGMRDTESVGMGCDRCCGVDGGGILERVPMGSPRVAGDRRKHNRDRT